jgi:DnaK suppressor protein
MSTATLPANYKPTEKEKYMNPQMLEYFRQKLLRWKDEIIKESDELLHELKDEGGMQEPDIADRASAETEVALELRSRDRQRKLIGKIDEALDRIGRGEYGYCEETGEPIGIKRLEARPVATLSVEAQERHERMERTHRDERE